MNTLAVPKNKITAARTLVSIKADASGKVPERVELVRAGRWGADSWKGELEITIQDLEEMRDNLNSGMGLPVQGAEGAPIDYKHEDWAKAAGWMKEFAVENAALWCTKVEWTPAGAQAIRDGEYKFISPSFYPACRGTWYDPEDSSVSARNVLVGAGLTNIPFFKGLSGLKAAQSDGSAKNNMLYINADIKGDSMDLATIRQKAPADVTEDEKNHLKEHQSELTADEQVAFGLVEKPAEPATPAAPATPATPPVNDSEVQAAAQLQADIRSGKKVVVDAAEYGSLKASVEANSKAIEGYEREKVEASVKAHAARGAIKSDSIGDWTNKIMADRSLEAMLTTLPDNKILAAELGKSGDEVSPIVQLNDKINEAVKASEGKIDYATAASNVRRENPELAKAYDEEIKRK